MSSSDYNNSSSLLRYQPSFLISCESLNEKPGRYRPLQLVRGSSSHVMKGRAEPPAIQAPRSAFCTEIVLSHDSAVGFLALSPVTHNYWERNPEPQWREMPLRTGRSSSRSLCDG